ncbi:NAD(P)-binding domain-containing protein [Streptomyces sp. NPDC002677]|uniref:NAD(P)-binding domain-containing protein n=1 Tax=Streptomyces sp. NPDC002677 TaxID=3154774 RepID=UPI00332A5DE1
MPGGPSPPRTRSSRGPAATRSGAATRSSGTGGTRTSDRGGYGDYLSSAALLLDARTHGVTLIDAPVSGGGPAAAEGRLVVMAGGEPGTVAYCRPVFATYADPVVHMGPLGTGQLAKLPNNVLFTASLATAADTLALGRDLKIDPAALARVLAHGSAAGFALDRVAAAGGTLDRFTGHAGPLLRKDVRLLTDVAETGGAEPAVVVPAAGAALALMNGQRPRLTSEPGMADPPLDEGQPHKAGRRM